MKKLSILFLFASLAFILSNCSSSNDPTPSNQSTKTDLQKIQSGLVGTKWDLVKSEVNDGGSVTTFVGADNCTTGKYAASVENFGLEFTDVSTVKWKNYCIADNNFDFNYTVTAIDDVTFSVVVTNISNNKVIDAVIKSSDVLNSDGTIKTEIKILFKEIASPANWKYSPTIYMKKN